MIEAESTTKTQRLIEQMGWAHRPAGENNVAIQTCPFCGNTNWKFFMRIGGEGDGLHDCKVCHSEGNYYQLKEKLGISVQNAVSVKDAATASTAPSPLPNFDAMHNRLMSEEFGDVLDHLVADRKYSMDVIKKFKIGAQEYDGMKWYVIPYWDAAGNPIYCKYRSVPPAPKKFRAPSGREVPLFNEPALKAGMDEIILCEGEADTLAMLSQGYENVVGVPGAGTKKAIWIDKLDRLAPKNIYLLYDRDKPGQDGAREMATRIGIDKVKNILLPEFQVGEKQGKDINEYFVSGRTWEDFEELKDSARQFDVQGVQGVMDILDELQHDIEENGVEPTYKTPWPPLTQRVGGFEEGDVIGLMAEGKVGKTTTALNWLEFYAEQGESVMLFCGEMLPRRLVRKWVSMVTQTDDTPGKSQITPETVKAAMEFAKTLKGDYLFGYTKFGKAEDVFDTIRQAVRRYGVKIVCFDNLQLLVRSLEHSAQETSKITKAFKALAMDLKIVILLIIQPNRVAEGQIVAARNASGSAAIEKDVDSMICLHRNRIGQIKAQEFKGFLDIEENFGPEMYVRADLTRYAPGGVCTLYMDGAKSTVREFSEADITTAEAQKPGFGIPTEAVAV